MLTNQRTSFAALYLPRTYRHLKEVRECLTKDLSFEPFERVVVSDLRTVGEKLVFSLNLAGDLTVEGEYHLIGMLVVTGSSTKVTPERLAPIAEGVYGCFATGWKALKQQLDTGAIAFGRSMGTADETPDMGQCFLECSADFIERLAERHRHSYPFEDPSGAPGTSALDPNVYVREIPQLVHRARQALICLNGAKESLPSMLTASYRAVEQQHFFVLEYLQLLNQAASAYHNHTVLRTQYELNVSQLALNQSMERLNRRIWILSILMVVFGALSVVVGAMSIAVAIK